MLCFKFCMLVGHLNILNAVQLETFGSLVATAKLFCTRNSTWALQRHYTINFNYFMHGDIRNYILIFRSSFKLRYRGWGCKWNATTCLFHFPQNAFQNKGGGGLTLRTFQNEIGTIRITQHCGAYANHWCYGNATMSFLFVVTVLLAHVNNIQPSMLPRERKNGFPLHCCRATVFHTAVNNIDVLRPSCKVASVVNF
jgi:hypothetical protein